METLVARGGTIKTLSDDGGRVRIGGYLVLFGTPEEHDATPLRDYFTPGTDFDIPAVGATSTVYYHHGLNPTLKARPLGKAKLSIRDAGVWMETELGARDEYEAKILELLRGGKLGLSSGTASHLVQRTELQNRRGEKVHRIDRWPLGLDASLTPTPAEPRTVAYCLKSLQEVERESWDELGVTRAAPAAVQRVVRQYVQGELSRLVWEMAAQSLPLEMRGWGAGTLKRYDPNEPRDERGRWTRGGGHSAGDAGRTFYYPMERLNQKIVEHYVPVEPHPFQPTGTPVKQSIEYPDDKRWHRVYAAIAAVHGDGNLPVIPLHPIVPSKSSEEGAYNYREHDGYAKDITVKNNGVSPELTALHETGHFLDHKGLKKKYAEDVRFATARLRLDWATEEQDEEWQVFHAAVTGSAAFKKLKELGGKKTVRGRGRRQIDYIVDRKHVQYLMKPEEVFTRAYCQYVATRSGDAVLRKQIASRLLFGKATPVGGESMDSLHYPEFWHREDFHPIAAALDKLFLAQGWLQASSVDWAQKDIGGVSMGPRENEEEPEELGLLPGWGVFDPDAEMITIEVYEGPDDDSEPNPYSDVHAWASDEEYEQYLNEGLARLREEKGREKDTHEGH